MELFKENEVASKSPYILWREKHGIQTKRREDINEDEGKWEAWVGDYESAMLDAMTCGTCYPCDHPDIVWDATEETAVLELAKRQEIAYDF